MVPQRPLVIGVGNRHRHDDAVGLEAAERVLTRLGDRVEIGRFDGDATGLLDLWAGRRFVVIVDAMASHGRPGEIHRYAGDLGPWLAELPTTSTHGLSVGEAWQLGRPLGQLPDHLVVFGVEGVDFSPGIGLSAPVARSLDPLTGAIVAEVLQEPSDLRPTGPRGPTDA